MSKWHSTQKDKPATEQVVVGYWVIADDETFVGLCYLDDLGHWYLAQDESGASTPTLMPEYWIERPNKH